MSSITLITGIPGHGKTLKAVEIARDFQKQGRPVYQLGLDDCDPAFAQALPGGDFKGWQQLPASSVLIVDEAHKFIPQRSVGRPEPHIEALAEIRHLGIELIVVTQDPKSVDVFVRRRVGKHIHVVRKGGVEGAILFTWDQVCDRPNDHFERKKATVTAWKYPKDLYGRYKSATMHLVKKSWPWPIYAAAILGVVLVGYVGWLGYQVVTGQLIGNEPVLSEVEAEQPLVTSNTLSPASKDESEKIDWLTAMTPAVRGLPWTAPIYQGAKPVEYPKLYCFRYGTAGCRCYTEQMTRVSVAHSQCITFVEDGVYRPVFEKNR